MLLPLTLLLLAAGGPVELFLNGGADELQDGWPTGWTRGWCRDGADKIEVSVVGPDANGQCCLRLVHAGTRDWSLGRDGLLIVAPGDILDLSVRLKIEDAGEVVLGAAVYPATYPESGEAGVDWVAGGRSVHGPHAEWVTVTTRIIIAAGMNRAQPRLIGTGPVTALIDSFSVQHTGNVDALRSRYRGPARLTLTGRAVEVTVLPATQAFGVMDKRTGRRWQAAPMVALVTSAATSQAGAAALTAEHLELRLPLQIGVATR